MLLDQAGSIFIGERRGPLLDAWQMPQGGIDPGEQPVEAAWRELAEEVGTDRAELLAESRRWYTYELPPKMIPKRWGSSYRGQCQRWFAFRFTGNDADIVLDAHEQEFSQWRWAARDEVLGLVVSFKRPVYEAVLAEFQHLIEG